MRAAEIEMTPIRPRPLVLNIAINPITFQAPDLSGYLAAINYQPLINFQNILQPVAVPAAFFAAALQQEHALVLAPINPFFAMHQAPAHQAAPYNAPQHASTGPSTHDSDTASFAA